MLIIKNLTKYYGNIKGVEDLSLEINPGEVFGFIGPNGAGKSTTIRCIMNLINKTSGNIYISGIENTKENISLKNDIGYLPSEINLYSDLTVKQMIDYSKSFYKKDLTNRVNYLVGKLELDLSKKTEDLSLGNLKKLGIILAMMHEPKLLIFDEATSGLDPLMQEKFYELILEEKEKGTTIFFSSHNLQEIKKICDRVGIIKDGHLIKIENIDNLIKNNYEIVTITSSEINKLKKVINGKQILINESTIKFISEDTANDLIDKVSKFKIDKILIEDSSIEDMFFHYYEV